MKIKIFSIITRNSRGGSSEFVVDLLSKNSKHFDVLFLYGGEKNIYAFNSVYVKELTREINLLKDLIAFFKILRFMLSFRPDIVYTHTSKAGIIGRLAGFLYKVFFNRKVKIIHAPHGHVFYGYFSKLKSLFFLLIEKFFSYITDVFIALSNNEKKESINFGLGYEDKWVIIPSGIDYNIKIKNVLLKKDLNLNDKDIIIGSVMRFDDIKGDKYFVLAANDVLKKISKDVKFILVGDGTNYKKIKDLIFKLTINDYFVVPGWQKDVYDWINIMDIYVQPSLNEGLGRTVIMAELLKKPVIASSVCGLKDLVIDGYNGFLTKPGDYSSISNAMVKLILDENMRIKMGENSFKLVNEEIDGFKKYSFERSVYLHEKLYKELVNK